jgi:outer membrane biogenesis lipoprotein LolB
MGASSALLLLAGCSASGGMHPNCIDLESAKKYDAEWQNDIQKARKSGKITLGMAIDAQGKRYEKLGKMKYERNRSEFCF